MAAEPTPVTGAPASRRGWFGSSPGGALAPWLLFLLTVAVHLGLSVNMRTPIIHADEYGYLMGAHFLARGGGPTGKPYSPGYSLLIVPFWWLSDTTATVYRWTLELNAVLAGLSSVLLFRLARRLAPSAGQASWAVAALVTAAYPATLLYSDLAESENLLIPGFLLLCLLVLRAWENPRPRRWLAVAVEAGFLYWVHERAVVVAPAVLMVALYSLRPWRRHQAALATAGAGLGVTLAIGALLTHWVTRSVPGRELPGAGSTAGHILSRLTSSAGLAHFGTELAGQGLYLMVGAGALTVLGLMALGTWRRRPEGWLTRLGGPLPMFLVLVVLAEAALAAVYLATGNRVDDALYGRYLEVFMPPVLLVGVLAGMRLAAPGRRWRGFGPALAGTAALVVTSLGVALHWGRVLSGQVVTSNLLAIADVVRGSPARVTVASLAGAGLIATLAVLAGFRLSALGGAAIALAVMVPASAYGYSYLITQTDGRVAERALPAKLVAMERTDHVSCVSWDSEVGDAWTFYNTRLFAPDLVFEVFNSHRTAQLPCASGLVVAGRSFSGTTGFNGAKLILIGPSPASLWVMPGPLARQLATQGLPASGG
ncbi:MAG: glycosyltransferase family 39 protein [Acidimicrobiales bacterium]